MHIRTLRSFIILISMILFSNEAPVLAQQPILSPRDSVEIQFAKKRISINYGRPSIRGRKIMGELVPYNKVWRTGANEATGFVTEVDLEMGGVVIPKGGYTLYTLPSLKLWKLIINKQTGQWGLVYNADLDLVRLNLKKTQLKTPVEKFTISFVKNGNNSGVLKLEWETTSLSIPFKVLKDSNTSSPSN